MIYIFQGCQNVCSLPGYLCSACGDACKSCPGACKACSGLCKGCGDEVKHFFERPLSVYVILSILLSLCTLSVTYTDMNPAGCTSIYLYILMGMAVVNIVFAIYLQRTVWSEIVSEKNHPSFIDGDVPTQTLQSQAAGGAAGLLGQAAGRAGGGVGAALGKAAGQVTGAKPQEQFPANPGKVIIPVETVQASFRNVFMEDFVVLFMFVALLGVFILSFMDPVTVDGKRGEGSKVCLVGEKSKKCAEAYFVIAALWSFMYMKCSCCANKVSVTKEEMAQKFPDQYGHLDEGNAAE